MYIKNHLSSYFRRQRTTTLAVLIGGAAVVALAVSLLFNGTLGFAQGMPDHLRIKADKSRILGVKEQPYGDVQYAYNSGRRVAVGPSLNVIKEAQKHGVQIAGEDLSLRTNNSRTFKTTKEDQFITEFISGVPQYYQDPSGEWWEADYATTTKEVFDVQIKQNPISRIFFASAIAGGNTFYPAEGASSPVDGRVVMESVNDTWANIRDGSGGGYALHTKEDISSLVSGTVTDRWTSMYRGIYTFNTSIIPDTAEISSATLSIAGDTKTNAFGSLSPTVNIFSSNPATTNDLTTGDYATLGTTAFSNAITYANWATGGSYNNFSLNASGIAAVSKTGVSKFGIREATYDAPNSPPSWEYNKLLSIRGYFADWTGTTYDPKLVVVHTTQATTSLIMASRKDATESTTSTTFQDDDDLSLDLIANKTYEVRGTLFASSTSATPDLKFRFTGNSGMTIDIGYIVSSAIEQSDSEDALLTGTGTTTTSSAVSLVSNKPTIIQFMGTVTTGSTGAGALGLQWAQANSSAAAVKVLKGSYLLAGEL